MLAPPWTVMRSVGGLTNCAIVTWAKIMVLKIWYACCCAQLEQQKKAPFMLNAQAAPDGNCSIRNMMAVRRKWSPVFHPVMKRVNGSSIWVCQSETFFYIICILPNLMLFWNSPSYVQINCRWNGINCEVVPLRKTTWFPTGTTGTIYTCRNHMTASSNWCQLLLAPVATGTRSHWHP